MKPLPHQQAFIDKNPNKAILNWECRVGKSLPASIWVDDPSRSGNTYIITLKKNKKSWEDFGTKARVITKEEFMKEEIINPTAIVVDEAHHFGSGLFKKGRSQRSAKLYNLLRIYPTCNVLLLTATPVKNDAWSFHTLLCYIGEYKDWKKWRDYFFEMKSMPYLRFPAYFPRKDWRAKLQPIVEKYTDIISLKDVVDYLPPVHSRIINIKQKKYELPTDEIVTWIHEHRHEQQGKTNEILKLGYKKVIVVAHYTEQIDSLAKELSVEKPVFVLDGRTKNAEQLINEAQEAGECYLIVQSDCGEGWDGWQFGCMVFASMSHRYVSNVQMHGRQRHPKNLRDIEIIYLLGGRYDRKIFECYNNAEDFNPHK